MCKIVCVAPPTFVTLLCAPGYYVVQNPFGIWNDVGFSEWSVLEHTLYSCAHIISHLCIEQPDIELSMHISAMGMLVSSI